MMLLTDQLPAQTCPHRARELTSTLHVRQQQIGKVKVLFDEGLRANQMAPLITLDIHIHYDDDDDDG